MFLGRQNFQPFAVVILVLDDAGNVIETHEYTGDFKEVVSLLCKSPV
jgi:hypothetical protein